MTHPSSGPPQTSSNERDSAALAIAEILGSWPDRALYMEIGLRAEALRLDPATRFSWSEIPAPPVCGQAAFPGLESLGERLVHRIERQIDELIAGGEPIDELERQRLLSASGLGKAEAAAEIAAALVAGFGLAPPIAPLAAAALCHRRAPAHWPALSDARRRETLSAISSMSAPKP